MSKTCFFSFIFLLSCFLPGCESLSKKGLAPRRIENHTLFFKTTTATKTIDKSLVDKEAHYVFNSDGSYVLYLENTYRNHGYYAYEKRAPNIAHLVISYLYGDQISYFVMYLQFTSENEGKLRASDLNSNIDELIATFQLKWTQAKR